MAWQLLQERFIVFYKILQRKKQYEKYKIFSTLSTARQMEKKTTEKLTARTFAHSEESFVEKRIRIIDYLSVLGGGIGPKHAS